MEPFRLNESHPRLKGLNDFYRTELSGWLQQQERVRHKAIREVMMIAAATLAVMGAVTTFGIWTGDPKIAKWSTMGLIVACGGGLALGYHRFSRIRQPIKRFLLERTCGFLGMSYRPDAPAAHLESFRALGLVPRDSLARLEDEITGDLEGMAFHIMDARLNRHAGTHARIVFEGPLVTFQVAQPVAGTTIVANDKGWFGKLFDTPGIPVERIEIDDRDFEAVFEVYGDDRKEARRLLNPRMIERLKALSASVGHGNLALAFQGRQVLVAINRKRDQFEVGSLTKPLDDPRRVQGIVDDIGFALGVAEALRLDGRP